MKCACRPRRVKVSQLIVVRCTLESLWHKCFVYLLNLKEMLSSILSLWIYFVRNQLASTFYSATEIFYLNKFAKCACTCTVMHATTIINLSSLKTFNLFDLGMQNVHMIYTTFTQTLLHNFDIHPVENFMCFSATLLYKYCISEVIICTRLIGTYQEK